MRVGLFFNYWKSSLSILVWTFVWYFLFTRARKRSPCSVQAPINQIITLRFFKWFLLPASIIAKIWYQYGVGTLLALINERAVQGNKVAGQTRCCRVFIKPQILGTFFKGLVSITFCNVFSISCNPFLGFWVGIKINYKISLLGVYCQCLVFIYFLPEERNLSQGRYIQVKKSINSR